jgi:hypothetical protein
LRRALQRGQTNQPDLTVPQSPGIILETSDINLLVAVVHLSSFNELETSYLSFTVRQRNHIHKVIHRSQVLITNDECRFFSKITIFTRVAAHLFTNVKTGKIPKVNNSETLFSIFLLFDPIFFHSRPLSRLIEAILQARDGALISLCYNLPSISG